MTRLVREWCAFDEVWREGATDESGTRQGPWRSIRADGSIRVEEVFEDGDLHGRRRQFHPDGALAIEGEWRRDRLYRSAYFRGKSETGYSLPADVDDRVARVDQVSEDGLTIRTTACFAADGTQTTAGGEPRPHRPLSVPVTGRFLHSLDLGREQPGGWFDGALDRCDRKLGLWRFWSPDGELVHTARYDAQGQSLGSFSADEPDPRGVRLQAFLDAPESFTARYQLGAIWEESWHPTICTRLLRAEQINGYVNVLLNRVGQVGRSWTLNTPRRRLALALLDSTEGAESLEGLELALSISDRGRLARWAPRVLSQSTPSDEVKEQIEAALSGAREGELDALDRQLRDGVRLADQDLVSIAARATRRLGLEVFLRDPKTTEALLLDEDDEAIYFDSKEFVASPVRVERRGCHDVEHVFVPNQPDERVLYWSGKTVWKAVTRYRMRVLWHGSAFFAERDDAEVTEYAWLCCESLDWAQRVMGWIKNARPKKARRIDPFYDERLGATVLRGFEKRGSLGVHGSDLVAFGTNPGLSLLWLHDGKGEGPEVVERFDSHEAAVLAFERLETEALRAGDVLLRFVAVPMASLGKAPPPKKKRAPEVVLADVGFVQPSIESELEAARELADAGDLPATLDALLVAWPKRPCPALAEAIETLSKRTATEHAVGGRKKNALGAWDLVELARNAVDLPALLRSLSDSPAAVAATRLDRLDAWPDDPRIDQRLVDVIDEAPYQSTSSQKFWRRLYDRLERSKDARILQRLTALQDSYEERFAATMGKWAGERVRKLVCVCEPTLSALRSVSLAAEEEALLEAILHERGPAVESAEAQLGQILGDPENLALRNQYADTQSDARAEFIALQIRGETERLSRDEKAREKALLEEHAPTWIGPLRKITHAKRSFTRGFLSGCKVKFMANVSAAIGNPYLATVETLECGESEIWAHPVMRSLRHLSTRSVVGDGVVAGAPLVGLDSLRCSAQDDLLLLLDSERFPNLRTLEVNVGEWEARDIELPQCAELRLVKTLSELHLVRHHSCIGRRHFPPLEEHATTLFATFAALRGVANLQTIGAEWEWEKLPSLRCRLVKGEGGYQIDIDLGRPRVGWGEHGYVDAASFLLDHLPAGCTGAALRGRVPVVEEWRQVVGAAAERAGVPLDMSRLK